MLNHNQRIKRILFCIEKAEFDDETLDIAIRPVSHFQIYLTLNKIKIIDDVNIYESLCDILWDGQRAIIKINNDFFTSLLKGGGELHIINDDIDYNHVNDVCANTYNPKNYELSYSVFNNFSARSAITLIVDPLKYPEFLSLVLFEFLKINNYPQDIKNIILLLYNDV